MVTTRNKVLLLALALVLLVSSFFVHRGGGASASLSLFGSGLSTESQEEKGTFVTSEVNPFSVLAQATKNFAAVNPDVKGWLMVPGTNINHPVTFNGTSNNYYLYRDWRGNNYPQITWQNWASYPESATYLDYRSKVGTTWETSSKNVVLYGHNWTNLRDPFAVGSNEANDRSHKMFAQLQSYHSIDFAKWQPHIYYSLPEAEGIWRVFAVGYTEVTPLFYYNNPNPSREQQQAIVDEWKRRSMFNFDVNVNGDDRLLVLTTCTRQYGSTPHQRFVVVARMLRPGESEKDPVAVTHNTTMQQPDFTRPVTVSQMLAQQAAQQQAAQEAQQAAAAPQETANPTPEIGAASGASASSQSAAGPSFFDGLN